MCGEPALPVPMRGSPAPRLLLLAAVTAGCSPPPGPGLGEIVEAALESHRERIEGVRDYTLVVETAGVRDTVHLRRDTAGETAVFVPVTGLAADLPHRETQDPYALLSVLSPENAELAGRAGADSGPVGTAP